MSKVAEVSEKSEEPSYHYPWLEPLPTYPPSGLLPSYPPLEPRPELPLYKSLFSSSTSIRVQPAPADEPAPRPREQTNKRSAEDQSCFPPNSFEKFCCK